MTDQSAAISPGRCVSCETLVDHVAAGVWCPACEELSGYGADDWSDAFPVTLGLSIRRFVRRAEVADLVDRILIDADRLRERHTDDWGPIQERLARLAELALEDR